MTLLSSDQLIHSLCVESSLLHIWYLQHPSTYCVQGISDVAQNSPYSRANKTSQSRERQNGRVLALRYAITRTRHMWESQCCSENKAMEDACITTHSDGRNCDAFFSDIVMKSPNEQTPRRNSIDTTTTRSSVKRDKNIVE